jgi:hypothetical protein
MLPPMRRKGLVLLVSMAIAGAASASLLAGCGDSSEGETTAQAEKQEQTAKQMTKREFVRRTQAQCHRGYLKQEAAMERYADKHGLNFGGADTREQEEINNAVVLDYVRKRIAYWKSLPRPKGDEKEIGKVIKAMEKGLKISEEDPYRLASGIDPEPFTENRHLTSAYGPWLCGQA